MGKEKKIESNFLVQGSILAVASIISRVIGLLYRIPLKAIIGDIGNDYLITKSIARTYIRVLIGFLEEFLTARFITT